MCEGGEGGEARKGEERPTKPSKDREPLLADRVPSKLRSPALMRESLESWYGPGTAAVLPINKIMMPIV